MTPKEGCRHHWTEDTYPCADGTWEPDGDLTCSLCGATGCPCEMCEGTGDVVVTVDHRTDEEDFYPCRDCNGTGILVDPINNPRYEVWGLKKCGSGTSATGARAWGPTGYRWGQLHQHQTP